MPATFRLLSMLPILFPACLTAAPALWTATLPPQPAAPMGELLPLAAGRTLVLDRSGTSAVLDAQLAVQQAADLRSDGEDYFNLPPVLLPDGGVALLERVASVRSCRVRRFDAGLQLRWTDNVDALGDFGSCRRLQRDGAGNLWVLGKSLFRLSDDGVQRLQVDAVGDGLEGLLDVAAESQGDGVYVAANFIRPGDAFPYADGVLRLAADGSQLWRWEDPDNSRIERIRRSSRGEVVVVGSASRFDSSRDGSITVLDAAGQVRWRRAARPAGSPAATYHAAADGSLVGYEYTSATGAAELFQLDPEGNEQWRRPRPQPAPNEATSLAILPADGGGLLLVETVLDRQSQPAYDWIERVDGAGRTLWLRRSDEALHDFQQRPDGSVLARTEAGRVVLLAAADGAASTPLAAAIAFDLADPQLAELDQAGRTVLVARQNGEQVLAAFSATGALDWRQVLDATPVNRLDLARADRICTLRLPQQALELACRAATDGSPLWRRELPRDSNTFVLDYRGTAEGRQQLLLQSGAAPNQAVVLQRFEADGTPAPEQTLLQARAGWARLAPGGAVLLRDAAASPSVLRTDASGTQLFRQAASSYGDEVLDGAVLQDGDSLLRLRLGPNDDTAAAALALVDASGTLRWRTTLEQPFTGAQIEVIEAGDAVYVAGFFNSGAVFGSPEHPFPTSLARLRRSDGRLQWQVLADGFNVFRAGKQLVLDRSGQRLGFVGNLRDSTELQLFDAADGRKLAQRTLQFAGNAQVRRARLDSTGRLRSVALVDGVQTRIGTLDDAFAARSSPIDHVGRTGAWFNPSSAGQGWLLEVLPDSRTLYAAWFTYETRERAPLATPARLRWYSLQGSYMPGAESVQLDILENRDGRFSAAPATSSRKVGSATLRFDSCGSGVLEYQLDGESLELGSNRVALQALAIRDPACASPAAAVRADGFDSAASGAWFDPATAGQGLVGVVQPPLAGNPGLLFAGWFHYDPADRADDDRRQAWLTLQGSLAGSTGGSAEVGIFRTLGGRLGGPSTRNTTRIGTARVRFEGCGRMHLDYQFAAGEVAAPYAGLAGSQQLVRLGPCTGESH